MEYWFIASILSALFWGLSYVISEILVKEHKIPYYVIVLFTGIITTVIWSCFVVYNKATNIVVDIIFNNKTVFVLLLIDALLIVFASSLLYYAIEKKNAVFVTFIEISYPFFTLMFSYFLLSMFEIKIVHIFAFMLIFVGSFLMLL